MRIKRLVDKSNIQYIAIEQGGAWKVINRGVTLLEILRKSESEIAALPLSDYDAKNYTELIPLKPMAYRDFMLYEKHAIDAARGFVKKYMSGLFPIVKAYESILGKPLPKLKPKKRYYQYPIYYMGNHLNFISNEDTITIPAYTKELDYELELAAVITKPLKNASIEEVNDAIGGFMILNDFSARDVQLSEIETGFGSMKTKNFGSAISAIVVHKEALMQQLDDLKTKVIINDKLIVES